MKRLAIVLGLLAVFLIPAGPVWAHTGSTTGTNNYCGHGVHWHWGSRTEYMWRVNRGDGIHRHRIFVAKWPLYRAVLTVRCS